MFSLLSYFEEMKEDLRDHLAVCVSAYPTISFSFSLWSVQYKRTLVIWTYDTTEEPLSTCSEYIKSIICNINTRYVQNINLRY
jgi:hypothetical protein